MRRSRLFVAIGVILVLGFVILIGSPKSPSVTPNNGSAYPSIAMEGTEDNPLARQEYEWQRLHDPATGRIPEGIAGRELEFMNRLDQASDLQEVTTAEDWTARGPYQLGGRTRALAIDVTNEDNILAASTSSGMFKSTDGGSSWVKTTAPNQLHSATSIAQNEAVGKENIWYYGTGDRTPVGMGSSADGLYKAHHRGDGIFKSVDGGDTWTQLASTASYSEGQTDAFDFVYGIETFGEDGIVAATAGGLFTSLDGGETWTNPIPLANPEVSPNMEVAKGPDGTLYASLAGDDDASGVYRSTDGMDWENFTPADWPGSTEKTVIAPAPSNANVVYFFIQDGALQQKLRKFDNDLGWTDLTAGLPFDARIATYGGILMELNVKPDDENTLFLGAIDLFRSTDGGQSFELISGHGPKFHPDQTSITFYPSNPNRMIVGNDGGLFRVENNTAATSNDNLDWESLNNGYLTTQFYTVSIDHGTPGSEVILGGTQDHGTVYTASSDPLEPWDVIFGGDGAYNAITDGGQYMYYASAATFRLYRQMGQQRTSIAPTGVGLGLFLTLFVLDPHDQKIMYLASRRELWRNSDLTGIPHQEGDGTTLVNWESFENVKDHYLTALGISEAPPRRLYYGAITADQGARLFRLENPHEGQPEPVDITSEAFPEYPYSPWISRIAVDPRDADKVIVVFPSYGVISMYASDDAGATWTPIAGNLEENPDGTGDGPSVRWLSILYIGDQPVYLAGTSVGLYSSTNLDGMNTRWAHEARTTIGSVVVDMIDVRQSDGFTAVATHGNGVYTTYITTVPTSTEGATELPVALEISGTYPNPFTTATTVAYELPRAGNVSAAVFDVNGRRVASLLDGFQPAGRREIAWTPAPNVADGVYLVRINYGGRSAVEKVVLQR